MAVTPEQFVRGLRQRGIYIYLEGEEPEPRFRLTGPKGKITEAICEYIRRNRAGICALFGQARCIECWRLVDERDEATYHMTEDGYLYCAICWDEQVREAEQIQERKEVFLTVARSLAAIFPDGCAVALVPDGMESAEYITRFTQQQAKEYSQDRRSPRLRSREIEEEALRIAERDGLPLSQARHWARLEAHLTASGYQEHYARSMEEQRARIAAYYETWLIPNRNATAS